MVEEGATSVLGDKSDAIITEGGVLNPKDYIAQIEPPRRRADGFVLLELFEKVSDYQPVMWGSSIVGYGKYHYRYDSGREGDSFRLGFAPRKANMVIYIMPGYQHLSEELSRLGKHRLGKACLYLGSLNSIDLRVLEEIAAKSLSLLAQTYPP